MIYSVRYDDLVYSQLGVSRHYSETQMAILVNNRKQSLLRRLVRAMNTLKTLHDTEFHLRDLIEVRDGQSVLVSSSRREISPLRFASASRLELPPPTTATIAAYGR